MRFKGYEFEDQTWFPPIIRDYMTGYLRFLFHTFDLYKPILPILKDALYKTNSETILDLCSGSGGAIERIHWNLKQSYHEKITVTLSDLYPNRTFFQRTISSNGISYFKSSVDATQVPPYLNGFRTIFSGFHHFDEIKAKGILKDAINRETGIGIFDGGGRKIWMILLIILVHPILLFFCTPFFRPFRFSRILYTYLLPIVPFCAVWDGVNSILRLYSSHDLIQMANEVDNDHYIWSAGEVRNKFGLPITYLIGYPAK